jgi:hypothetical protein
MSSLEFETSISSHSDERRKVKVSFLKGEVKQIEIGVLCWLQIIENCATNAAAKQVLFVIPAEAGIQYFGPSRLDSRVRGNDETALWLRRDQ